MKNAIEAINSSFVIDVEENLRLVGENRFQRLGICGGQSQKSQICEWILSEKLPVDSVSASPEHTLVLLNNKTLWAAGIGNRFGRTGNTSYSLGNPSWFQIVLTSTNTQPALSSQVNFFKKAVSSSLGSIIIDNSDRVWATGNFGCLLNSYWTRSFFPDLSGSIIDIAGGSPFALAIDRGGNIFALGGAFGTWLGAGKDFGCAGFFSPSVGFTWFKVGMISNASKVVSLYQTSFVLTTDGFVYGTGLNTSGQLGLGNSINQNLWVPIPKSAFGNNNIIQIAPGLNHSLALDENGTLYVTGSNSYGQIGRASTNTWTQVSSNNFDNKRVVAIAAGDYHSFAVTENGSLYVTGRNNNYQLGTGDDINRASWTKIGKFGPQ